MKTIKIKAIYKKEIMDLLRDKKTLIMMILVPLLLYPLIMMGALMFGSSIANSIKTSEYTIAVIDKDAANNSQYDGKAFRELLADTEDEAESNLVIKELDANLCAESLSNEEIDAYIEVVFDGEKNTFKIYYLSSITASSSAANNIENKLEIYSELLTKNMLIESGMDPEVMLNPVEVDFEDKSADEERIGSMLGMILPYLLVTSILMGALYPSIDATAGEKERGTLETLLTLPVKNSDIIIGKFLAVSTIAVASAVLNLISMLFVGLFFYSTMQSDSSEALSLNLANFVPALLVVLLCVIAFAFFMSAITMCVSTFAKSFKEANNYQTPLLLVIMLASFVSFVPNIEFTPLLATVPVVNICLLLMNILVFKYSFSLIIVVLITNIAYAAIAILFLIKLYNSEDMLFGEGGVSLQLFTNRKHLKKGGVPNLSDAALVMAVALLLVLYIGTLAQMKFLIYGLIVTQLLIISVPVFAAWYTKKSFKETFSLNTPRPIWILSALLIEISGYSIVLLMSYLLGKIFPQDLSQVNESFLTLLNGVGFIPALLIIALSPAICEEFLFRGYMLSASKKKLRMISALLLGATLFGLYHMSLVKFFTTGFLGFIFCYVVYKTGSIFLTMLMHFINNAITVIVLYYPEEMNKAMPILFKESFSVIESIFMLLIGIIGLVIGILTINKNSK